MEHHPPHLFLDDTWTIITAATVNHVPFLASQRAKAFLRNKLRELIQEFHITLKAWVILNDHYHLLLKSNAAKTLPRFFGKLHGSTAFQFNQWDNMLGRQIWHNYWDTCLRNERAYWTRFNYIHQNPVKHGYVPETGQWPFSSYHFYLRKYGAEWLAGCLGKYPVLDYLEGDDF